MSAIHKCCSGNGTEILSLNNTSQIGPIVWSTPTLGLMNKLGSGRVGPAR